MNRLGWQPDLSKYVLADKVQDGSAVQHNPAPAAPYSPGFDPMLRCPIPQVSATSDGLRQYYRGSVPQYRLVPPPTK